MSPQQQTTQKMIADNRTSRERLEALEKTFIPLIQSIGKQFDEVKAKSKLLEELVDTLIGMMGTEAVAKALEANRMESAVNKANEQKADTERLKSAGVLVPQTTIDEKCVLILSGRKTETGAQLGAGWVRLSFADLKEELKSSFLGKEVGFETTDETNTYTVLEILGVDMEKASALTTETTTGVDPE